MKPLRELLVYCDGGSRGNPGPGAAGCVVKDSAGNERLLCGKYLGRVTNNQAEYSAVELALTKIKKHFRSVSKIHFLLDSKLVANQLGGLYKIKDPQLRETAMRVRGLEASFGETYYQHIGRSENIQADALVNKVLDERRDFEKTVKG
jgi:ribonuclease HI